MPDDRHDEDWRIIHETAEALRKRKAELDADERAEEEPKPSPSGWTESAREWRGEREKNERIEREQVVHLQAVKNARQRQDQDAPPEWVDFSVWDDEPVPEQEWTLSDKIPRRQVCLFSGEGAAGKSTIALHLACAHVLGKDCLQAIAAQGPAFFIDAEDDIGVVHRRLAALKEHYQTTFAELHASGLNILPLAGKDAILATVGKGVVLPTKLYEHVLAEAIRLKPQLIVLASSANVFAIDENDRSQVTQAVGLLTRLAIASNGSVLLIAHPSLTGIANGTGLSGSTQWHNAVRARLVITTIKPDGDDPDAAPQNDIGLRLLECQKNQYGPPSAAITLQYQRGMFLPRGEPSMFEKAAKEAKADALFLKYGKGLGNLSPRTRATNYAPKVLAALTEVHAAKIKQKDMEQAMYRLLTSKKVRIEEYGPPSCRAEKLVFE